MTCGNEDKIYVESQLINPLLDLFYMKKASEEEHETAMRRLRGKIDELEADRVTREHDAFKIRDEVAHLYITKVQIIFKWLYMYITKVQIKKKKK